MIGGALYVRVTLQGLARLCISLTSHLATFCTFADGKTCSSDEEMGRFERNVVPCHTAFCSTIRRQVLLDRKVRKLNHGRAFHIHDGNQARAGRQHRVSGVFRPPVPFKRKPSSCFRFECEKFGEFFNPEWTASNRDALEETVRILPIFIVYIQ